MNQKFIFILLFVPALAAWVFSGLINASAVTTATTRYVDPSGSDDGGNTCANPAAPCKTLQYALNEADNGDTIRMAAGVYNVNVSFNKSLTINGDGSAHSILDGGSTSSDRVIQIQPGKVVQISGVTIRNGRNDTWGGGIENWGTLTLTQVIVSDNASPYGGGIFSGDGGVLTLTDATIRGNTATGTGLGNGGGLYNSGQATLQNSTFSGNAAVHEMGGGLANNGGADMSLTNVTISGNSANDAAGLFNGGTLTVTNSTIANNQPGAGLNGVVSFGAIRFKNSMVVNNGNAAQCGGSGSGGTFTSDGYNLENGGSCGFNQSSDLPNSIPKLNSLDDNGGPTQTHSLQSDSPAIDAGTNSGCPATDQRGMPRPVNGVCDIGAFEFGAVVYLPAVLKP